MAQVRRVEADYLVIDTAPNDRALGASIAVADLILIPCTPSGLDIEATVRTLEIIDNVRARRKEKIRVILVPNRVDQRTLEGQQLADELIAFGEPVAAPIGDRSVFVRAFTTGQSVGDLTPGQPAEQEIRALCEVVEGALARSGDQQRRSKHCRRSAAEIVTGRPTENEQILGATRTACRPTLFDAVG